MSEVGSQKPEARCPTLEVLMLKELKSQWDFMDFMTL
jgi:hypothetical protein